MPKPYVPTGRPPGRPSRPLVEKLGIRDVPAQLRDLTADRAHRPMDACCPDCFPGGFPQGSRALACQHGTWVKRL
jgi:hypothetical protein